MYRTRLPPYTLITHSVRAVDSLVVRASDSRPEGLGSMPDATKYPPSTHGGTCSLNQWVRSLVGRVTSAGRLENISLPFSSM
ncbi:hypothetical protein TNCV_276871 [Trichonephila clavipes]|uniref:Uncharacterized protein n=1 Tax=Trichonephila clavipes TaxID=2585209 RepID=A0A8X6S9G7_TRICX|nr:hypothetical protein TNCV_276871 [Trichonephila clavipes]